MQQFCLFAVISRCNMSYDLRPRNKKIDELTIDAFSWPMMLQETGMGFVLGYGANIQPASYVYNTGRKGSPVSNDGYRVTSSESKAMAAVCRGYISVKRFINKQYEEASDEQKNNWKSALYHGDKGIVKKLYKQEVSEDFLVKLEKFAEFAEQSNGFGIF